MSIQDRWASDSGPSHITHPDGREILFDNEGRTKLKLIDGRWFELIHDEDDPYNQLLFVYKGDDGLILTSEEFESLIRSI